VFYNWIHGSRAIAQTDWGSRQLITPCDGNGVPFSPVDAAAFEPDIVSVVIRKIETDFAIVAGRNIKLARIVAAFTF